MTNTKLWIQPEELAFDLGYTQYAEEAAQVASYLLWAMSGRKYTGETIVTERYTCVLRNNRMGPSIKTNSPILFGGDVYNIPSGDYDEYSELTSDGMSPDARIKLRGRPVTKIHTIRNRTGQIIDPSQYYLVDHSTIHIKAGTPWTPCNTEITYSYGAPVPTAGKMAARTLATEFAKLWNGDEDCSLPQRVTSVSRQGVSYTILDNQEFIEELRTGLYAVDLFLKTTNPDNARRRSKVFSPDQPRARRYTPREATLTADADYDITLIKSAAATWSSSGTDANLSNFFPDSGWEPLVRLYNYSGTKYVDLSSSDITLNYGTEVLSFTVSYDNAIKAIGMVDPGTWTLFATKTIAGVENVVTIASGNLKIKLYT
jgi:hypothetical protein